MRPVKVATASILLEGSGWPSPCIERAYEAVRQAAAAGADIVCLPEEINLVCVDPHHYHEVAEAVPGGEIVETMRTLARDGGLYVLCPVRERADETGMSAPLTLPSPPSGERVGVRGRYNTVVVIDRRGEIVGCYRKTHLVPGSEDREVTAGDDLPVFELDFGRIGIQVCMDLHYPEAWRVLGLRGAEILFLPTMQIDYTGDYIETLIKARAIDNACYVVSSHYVEQPFLSGRSMGHSRIVDPYGRTRADTSHRPGIAVATIDLDENYEMWYTGEMKRLWPTMRHTYFATRRPELYGELAAPDEQQRWRIANPVLHRPAS